MGFKLHKSKSWKSMGKEKYWKKTGDKAGSDQNDFWQDKDGSKADWFQDKDGSKKSFFEGFGKEKNWAKAGDIFEEGGGGVKDTWNAASAGIGRSMGGLNDTMSNMLLAGGLALGAIIIIPMMLPSGKSKNNNFE
jgi:hypothetical protein